MGGGGFFRRHQKIKLTLSSYFTTYQPKKFLEGAVFLQAPPEYIKVDVL